MPIYDFTCQDCGKKFDQLCSRNWEGTVSCPDCGRSSVIKLISLVSNFGRSGGNIMCGSCSSGSCGSCTSN